MEKINGVLRVFAWIVAGVMLLFTGFLLSETKKASILFEQQEVRIVYRDTCLDINQLKSK